MFGKIGFGILVAVFCSACGGQPSSLEGLVPRVLPSDQGNAQEREMIGLIRAHPRQKRAELVYDARLARAARAKARDMAVRGYFGHEDPEGVGANYHVLASGYDLPTAYRAFKGSNQIESLAAGKPTARETMEQWMDSWGHEGQVLALAPFYREQTRYGVGYFYLPESKYRYYWVFLSAPPERS